jgi:hypothetical protein
MQPFKANPRLIAVPIVSVRPMAPSFVKFRLLVSYPISSMAFVAIKMGRRSGSCRTKAMLFMGQDTSIAPA